MFHVACFVFFEAVAIIPSLSFKPGAPTIVTPEQKKQKKLIFIFIAVLILTGIVLYYNFSSPETQENPLTTSPNSATQTTLPASQTTSQTTIQEEVPSLDKVELDFSLFKNPKFGALRDFSSEVDISGIEKGRKNPFIKY